MKRKVLTLLVLCLFFYFEAEADNAISDIKYNVYNQSDESSRINSGIDIGTETTINGNGILAVGKRSLEQFTGIDLKGPFKISIKCGEKTNEIEIETDSNLLETIKTEIKDGILVVWPAKPCSFTRIPVLKLSCVMISKIKSSGSAEINITGIKTPSFGITMSGRGKADIYGETEDFFVKTSGSASVYATNLICKNIKIEASGSGEMKFNSVKSLSAKIRGSTKIYLPSRPEIFEEKISGSGEVIIED
ncbi:MAG TPA: DUF2807 domain-containing protein [Victivallales bacterium]|nr:DUF2807 domain-containing protein [Victivallales bacterium]